MRNNGTSTSLLENTGRGKQGGNGGTTLLFRLQRGQDFAPLFVCSVAPVPVERAFVLSRVLFSCWPLLFIPFRLLALIPSSPSLSSSSSRSSCLLPHQTLFTVVFLCVGLLSLSSLFPSSHAFAFFFFCSTNERVKNCAVPGDRKTKGTHPPPSPTLLIPRHPRVVLLFPCSQSVRLFTSFLSFSFLLSPASSLLVCLLSFLSFPFFSFSFGFRFEQSFGPRGTYGHPTRGLSDSSLAAHQHTRTPTSGTRANNGRVYAKGRQDAARACRRD